MHEIDNVVPACRNCNMKKGARPLWYLLTHPANTSKVYKPYGRAGRTQTGAPILLRPETPEQRARWQAAADLDGRKLVAWVRRALDEVAGTE
jgi:hypothetical protein